VKQNHRTKFLLALTSVVIGLLFPATGVAKSNQVQLLVLGVAQDAGYPQSGCYQAHCLSGWQNPDQRRTPTSLAIFDPKTKSKLIFEATPALPQQLFRLHQVANSDAYQLDGIFLTHAHVGHYTGLMYLGHEAMGTSNIPVFAMPKMSTFILKNGPWSQLVKYQNIVLKPLTDQIKTKIKRVAVTPFLVPHRDEYSETVGYQISGPQRTAVFIPDINKWHDWSTDLAKLVKSVDYAFLDATFFADGELPGRDMSKIPHPFVTETMALLADLAHEHKQKVWFIHFNHTNPLLFGSSPQSQKVREAGFNVAYEGLQLSL
jgi:pyrroloquinoline quinone biosynthesis protein B